MPVEEGKAAPAFRLKDTAGNTVSLKDFTGQDVIVYFYPKDDTPGCTKEACGFRDVWRDIQLCLNCFGQRKKKFRMSIRSHS